MQSHLDAKGYNAMAVYDCNNCWVRNVNIVDATNGIFLVSWHTLCVLPGLLGIRQQQRCACAVRLRSADPHARLAHSSSVPAHRTATSL